LVAEPDHPNVSFIFIIFMEEAGKNQTSLQIKGKKMMWCYNSPFAELKPTDLTFNVMLPCQDTMFTE